MSSTIFVDGDEGEDLLPTLRRAAVGDGKSEDASSSSSPRPPPSDATATATANLTAKGRWSPPLAVPFAVVAAVCAAALSLEFVLGGGASSTLTRGGTSSWFQAAPSVRTRNHWASSASSSSAAVFVFIVGVEGTGHHLFQNIYKSSPSYSNLTRWGMEGTSDPYGLLMASLWDNRHDANGLLSATCADLKGGSRENGPNGTALLLETAARLREMEEAVRENQRRDTEGGDGKESTTPTAVALSAFQVRWKNATFKAGMMSYPNFGQACRFLAYPDLNLLYAACDIAGVDCRHVVVHRDALQVLRSTVVNRHHGRLLVEARLHATMLGVIQSQMHAHPERLAACWDYGSGSDDDDAGIAGGILGVGRLLGWTEAEFRRYYPSVYKKSPPLDESTREMLLGSEMAPFVNSMARAMDQVRDNCRKIYNDAREY